jgi:hypothetical protein
VGIGAGTVSSIINESRQNDPEFDLLRQVAVYLKNMGMKAGSFAPLIRCREILEGLLATNTGGENRVANSSIASILL